MLTCILSPIDAKWLHGHACLHACHVPALPHGGMGILVPHLLCPSTTTSNVGVPICTPDVFRCYHTVAWHTHSHTCLVSAPTHDVLGSSVLTSAKFQGYHVVVQVCPLAHQPCPNNAVCWHRHASFLTCHAPMPSSVGTGMPVHMPAMSQHCNLAAGACLFAHLPYPITAK